MRRPESLGSPLDANIGLLEGGGWKMLIKPAIATPGYLMSGGIGAFHLVQLAGNKSAWRQTAADFPAVAVKRHPSVDVPTSKVPPPPPGRCP
jgi:hypothetical protein